MAKFEVVYTVRVRGNTADGDCYDGESFEGTTQERTQIDAINQSDADEKAMILVKKEFGKLISVVIV